jgi:hypothetical protein
MSDAADLLRSWLRQADARAVDLAYAAVGVSTEAIRRRLGASGRVFFTRDGPAPPTEALDRTADWLIEQSAASSATLGGVAGLGGLLSVPPEVGAFLVASLRLAQRLAVVYGFDPETERGRMAVAQALAEGFEVALPPRGLMGTKASDVVRALVSRSPSQERVGGQLALGVVLGATRMMGGRLARLVPVVSSGVSAVDNRRRTLVVGARMRDALRRQAELPWSPAGLIEDATELR